MHRCSRLLCYLLPALMLLGCASTRSSEEARALWNGRDFSGWRQAGGGTWTIEDGVIVGRNSQSEPRHGHLITTERYGDFKVGLTYRALSGNSGLYLRVEETGDQIGVRGFQAEIDAQSDVGGLYETYGREWVVKPTPEQISTYFKPGDWNEMTVEARGRNIVVHVNGVETARLMNDPSPTAGHIALQIHGGQDVEVHFKNVWIDGEPVE